MTRLLPLILASVLLAAPVRGQVPLELISALPVEGMEGAQLSGLTLVDDELYAVSDQHDHTICRLDIGRKTAKLSPYITFNAPWSGAWVRGLDFEGIAHRENHFFLVSESTFRVLRVGENGGDLAWVTPSVEKQGLEAGFFGKKNGRLEGLALLGGGRVLLAVERAPRGLIDVTIDLEGNASIQPIVCAETMLSLANPRVPDFSDFWIDDEGLFALSRNADAVLLIDYDEQGLREREAWTFSHVVNDPAHAYQDMTYGKAEGLAMDENRVYVVVDNNGLARVSDGTDTRPLLFVFARP